MEVATQTSGALNHNDYQWALLQLLRHAQMQREPYSQGVRRRYKSINPECFREDGVIDIATLAQMFRESFPGEGDEWSIDTATHLILAAVRHEPNGRFQVIAESGTGVLVGARCLYGHSAQVMEEYFTYPVPAEHCPRVLYHHTNTHSV